MKKQIVRKMLQMAMAVAFFMSLALPPTRPARAAFQWPDGGTVYGVVQGSDHTLLGGVSFLLWSYPDRQPGAGYAPTSLGDGTYSMPYISSGKYILDAIPQGHPYWSYAESEPFFINAPGSTEVNFTLPPAGEISGTVRDHFNNPIPGTGLAASLQSDPTKQYYGSTDSAGNYSIPWILPGTYIVTAGLPDYLLPFENHIYKDTNTLANASPVQVAAGATSGGIDFDFDPLALRYTEASGGTLTLSTGTVSMVVPPDALTQPEYLTILGKGAHYTVNTDEGLLEAVIAVDIGPAGTNFAKPVSITFHWQDANNDGFVDGTGLNEATLVVSKDGVVIAGPCSLSAACDPAGNTFTVQVTSLSQFVLAAPPGSDFASLRSLIANAPANAIAANNKKSLLAKVDNAISSLNKGNKQAAIGQLNAFINEAQAQRGKKITASMADLLITYARNVIAGMP